MVNSLEFRVRKHVFSSTVTAVYRNLYAIFKSMGCENKASGIWKPRLIVLIPHEHLNQFITALEGKVKVEQSILGQIVNRYEHELVC